jgi:hypothetical protein
MRIELEQELPCPKCIAHDVNMVATFIGPPKLVDMVSIQNLKNSEIHARQSNRKGRQPRERNLENECINSRVSELLSKRELRELARERKKQAKQANKIPKESIHVGSLVWIRTREYIGIATIVSVDVYYSSDTSKRGNLTRKVKYLGKLGGNNTTIPLVKSQIINVLS